MLLISVERYFYPIFEMDYPQVLTFICAATLIFGNAKYFIFPANISTFTAIIIVIVEMAASITLIVRSIT